MSGDLLFLKDDDGWTLEIYETTPNDNTLTYRGRVDLFSQTLVIEGKPARLMPSFENQKDAEAWVTKVIRG